MIDLGWLSHFNGPFLLMLLFLALAAVTYLFRSWRMLVSVALFVVVLWNIQGIAFGQIPSARQPQKAPAGAIQQGNGFIC